MKILSALFFILFSVGVFPSGDKGNLSGVLLNLNTSSFEMLLGLSAETEENLFEPLAEKSMDRTGQLRGTDVLGNEKTVMKFYSLVNELVGRNETEILSALVFKSDLFYEAFGTLEVKRQIAELQISEEEKLNLARKTDETFQRFFSELLGVLKARHGAEAAATFCAKINQIRLGYKLSIM